MGAPSRPCSPMRRKTSRWTSPFASHSRMYGLISASANSRTDCWTRRFSSVGRRSITRGILAGPTPPRRSPATRAAGHGNAPPVGATRSGGREWPRRATRRVLAELAVVVEEAADILQEEPAVTALAHAVVLQLAAVAEPLHRVHVEVQHLRDFGRGQHLAQLVQSHRAHPVVAFRGGGRSRRIRVPATEPAPASRRQNGTLGPAPDLSKPYFGPVRGSTLRQAAVLRSNVGTWSVGWVRGRSRAAGAGAVHRPPRRRGACGRSAPAAGDARGHAGA